ncbi:anti-lipopolysaccharide factor-like isoform X2 [Penaeus japonicus]|uniref:anti-lipopolysaccharide factor-like isoform X1 n=1 Tax=Penaeus japonicus TaxID=27405 RepID=UPI001C71203D|nr:anti-lipopolysaccharide factor-like isoform X1 [Penaeus japonicus]XP_042886036.1 anti-lipopolysaccharide factor-like isoform X2 [Penaeus japonicus]
MGRIATFVGAVLLVASAAPWMPQCQAQGLKDFLLPVISQQIAGLWRTGTVDLLDHLCTYNVKPDLQRFELYFIGTVTCPSWTVIKGESETRSQSGVVNDAVKDFVKKALKAGLVTEEEAKPYIV